MTSRLHMWFRSPPIAKVAIALAAVALAACSGNDAPAPEGGVADIGSRSFRAASDGAWGSSSLGDYLAGSYALEAGELDEAASHFERALAADPDNLDLLRQLFLLTLASGRYDQALDQARQLAERDPEADEARLLIALHRVEEERFAAAREALQELDQTGIAALAVPFLEAWVSFSAGGADATDDAVARLAAGEPLGSLNDYHSAMILDLGGRTGEALDVLSRAMPEAGPAPARMVQARASMLVRTGQRAEAIDLLRAQLAEDRRDERILHDLLAEVEADGTPEQPFAEPGGGMADALLGIAEALHQERGGARAVIYSRLASFVQPDLAEASLLIGDIMAEQENYDAALRAYDEVAPDSSFGDAARLRKARTLYSMERKEEAYDLLEKLAGAASERTEALVQLGDLLRREEHYDRAERAYSRAIERIDEPEREHWTLFYARGITYERTKRWPEAEEDFLRALELEPEQPFVLNYLGYSWVDKGTNLDRAKGMLNRAVELRPNDGFIVDSLGWVHYRLGDYKVAVEKLERAVELEPGDPVINDHLGDAYWRVGREREARYQWQRALSLEPEEDQIAEIEQKLRIGLPDEPDGTGQS